MKMPGFTAEYSIHHQTNFPAKPQSLQNQDGVVTADLADWDRCIQGCTDALNLAQDNYNICMSVCTSPKACGYCGYVFNREQNRWLFCNIECYSHVA